MFFSTALYIAGYFYVNHYLEEKLRWLKVLYFDFLAIFGICIMQSKLASTELCTNRAAAKLFELALNKFI